MSKNYGRIGVWRASTPLKERGMRDPPHGSPHWWSIFLVKGEAFGGKLGAAID
ncbi:MAG: hypothetical protein OXC55_03410 [Chloroflexi bacterium]|nr:hypothetical protein [Chloroflexota bacterium]